MPRRSHRLLVLAIVFGTLLHDAAAAGPPRARSHARQLPAHAPDDPLQPSADF